MELLIAATLAALVGVALMRILIGDSRFVASQQAMLDSRQAARAAMNTMSTELRGVAQGGLLRASRDSVVAVVPYAFGMACGTASNTVTGALVPADSLTYAIASPDTIAWRDPVTGAYTFAKLSTVAASTNTASCTQDSIRLLAGGRLIDMSGIPASRQPPPGALFYLGWTIRYKFAASTTMPGRIALWRKAGSAAYEEVVVPFDTSARFRFLVGPSLTVRDVPPALLDSVRGLEVHLVAQSPLKPPGVDAYQRFDLVTRLPFLNVVR